MNAREQREIVEALRQSGALAERGEYEGGSLQRWVEIPWEAVLGRLSQFGWKVSLKPKDAPPLTLESS